MPRPPYCCHRVTCSRETQQCPDIVGSGPVGWLTDAAYGMSGAFFCKQDAGESIAPSAANREYREGFDASRCSSVYGSAETVLPSSVRVLACIKI